VGLRWFVDGDPLSSRKRPFWTPWRKLDLYHGSWYGRGVRRTDMNERYTTEWKQDRDGGIEKYTFESQEDLDSWIEQHRGRSAPPKPRKVECDIWGIVYGRPR
jgi:hypothetical protein